MIILLDNSIILCYTITMKYEPIYDRKYLGLCLEVIKDDLDEIIKWSVRNGDKCLDEMTEIENKLKELKKKI